MNAIKLQFWIKRLFRFASQVILAVAGLAVLGCPSQPTAQFTAQPVEGVRPLAVNFQDLSGGNGATISSWSWNFGDGVTSSDQNPSHTYTSEGLYSVSLAVKTSSGSAQVDKQNLVNVKIPFADEQTEFQPPTGVATVEIGEGVNVQAAEGEILISVKRDITKDQMDEVIDELVNLDMQVVGYSAGARLLQARLTNKSAPLWPAIEKLDSEPLVTSVGPNMVTEVDEFTVGADNDAGRQMYLKTPAVRVPAYLMFPQPGPKQAPVPASFGGDYWVDLIGAPEAWDIGTGSSAVTVGIVDAGITAAGVIDNTRLSTFYSDGTTGSSADGHGTFVTALAAGDGGDSVSDAVGMAWDSPIVFITYKKSVLGLFFVTDLVGGIIQAVDQNARVVNLSAGPGPMSSITMGTTQNFLVHRRKFREQMTSTLDYARQNDVLVCFSAGNDGFALDENHIPPLDLSGDGDADDPGDFTGTTTLLGTPNYVPGATVRNDDQLLPTGSWESPNSWTTNALIVGAAAEGAGNSASSTFADAYTRIGSSGVYRSSDFSTGMIGQFSRLGEVVDLVAPGVEVSYGSSTGSGTSYAAPLVTGTAALVLGVNPQLAAVEVRRMLLDSANDEPFQGRGAKVGKGLVDAKKAAELAESSLLVPVHPTISAELRKDHTASSTVTVTVPEEGVRALDVVILTDISSSYYDDIDTLKTRAADVVTALAAQVEDVQFGLASFSDFPISPYGTAEASDEAYFLNQRVTADLPSFFTAVDQLTTLFGYDDAESQLEALYQLATGAGRDINVDGDYSDLGDIAPMNIGWRPGAMRLVILSTDAPFHDSDSESAYPGPGFTETMAALNDADITVLGLYSSSYGQADVQAVADATEGAALSLTSGSSNIVQAISDALDMSFQQVDVSIEILNDPEGFVQGADSLLVEDVVPGEIATFTINLKGVLNQSLTKQRFNIRAWAVVNRSGLVLRIPIEIEVPSLFDF